jgi:hypothetical protein
VTGREDWADAAVFLVVSLAMAKHRPSIQAACLCERVIEEKDGGVTLVRMVDTFTALVPEVIPENVGIMVPLTLFIALKAGEFSGSGDLGIRLHKPDSTEGPLQTWPVVLESGVNGALHKVDMQLKSVLEGSYRVDVLWNGEELTSVPFLIKFTKKKQDFLPVVEQ